MGTRQKTAEPTDLKESLDFAADAVIKYNFGNTNWIPLMLRNSSFIIQPEEILADVDLLIAMEGVLASGCKSPSTPPWRSRARSRLLNANCGSSVPSGLHVVAKHELFGVRL